MYEESTEGDKKQALKDEPFHPAELLMAVRSRHEEQSLRAEPCRAISAAAPLCSETSRELCTDRKCCRKCLRGRRNLQNEIVLSVFALCQKKTRAWILSVYCL